MKNDIELQRNVLAQLERDCRLGANAIGVEVHHGVVKLAGSVRDDATIQIVELASRHVEGVATVVMDIDVINTPWVRRSGLEVAPLTPIA